jgi:hypothetical protein
VRLSGKHCWPLFASVSVHAAIATALVVSPGRTSKPEPPRLESRDIWIGETLEMTAPAGGAEEHHESSAPEAPQPTEAAKPAPAVAYTPKNAIAPSKRAGTSETPAPGAQGGMKSDERAGARGFAKAFTRALPAANNGDPVWGELPIGSIGVVRVSVVLDDEGAIAESKVWDRPKKPPSYLARLVDRTLIMLRGGRFALAKTGSGKETLKLDVTLSERPMESGPLALGFDAPGPGNPGRAYFQLASGRLVDTKVTIEPN